MTIFINRNQKEHITRVQRMLFPLSPLVQRIEYLLTLLPRRYQPVSLVAEAGIKIVAFATDNFHATNSTPYFKVIFESTKIPSGWFYLEAAITNHNASKVAKLHIDLGYGFNDADSVIVPTNFRGSIREVIFLPKGIKALRWQPMQGSGWFSQSPLIFHSISWLEGYYRRAWRVACDLWKHRHLSGARKNILSLTSIVFDINNAYAWSAKLRLSKNLTIKYEDFINRNDKITNKDIKAIEHHIYQLFLKPELSIVMPVYNPPIRFFREALDSILAQNYPYWQLCLADDASADPEVKKTIEEYLKKDSRIKVVYCKENGHISAASNSALEIATGEFVVLMDQDDLLPSHALYHVAVEINRNPDVCLIYSDEDKIDEIGTRFDPYFKSDWNLDLFYSQNMFSHLGVYKTSLVREVGGFRLGYEGAQDYDLTLRCVAKTTPNQIKHIPRVLYHWRAHAKSTALSHSTKNYAELAGYKALQNHFHESDAHITKTDTPGMYRVIYPLPAKAPLVTLIIPTRDNEQVLRKCIESIKQKTIYPNFELLIVDNQSTDEKTLTYLDSLKIDRRFRIIKFNSPFNYSAINNYAASLAHGEIIGLVNNDVEVINKDWLCELVRHALRADVGAVGAKLLYSDRAIQHAGVVLGIGGLAGHSHKFYDHNNCGYFGRANLQQELSAVTGACLLVRKNVFEQVGGLDENLPIAFNDVDFCIKVRELGLKNIYTPYSILYHHESISRGQEDSPEKQARLAKEILFMKDKWGSILLSDPFYNPNLSHDREDFSLANHRVTSSHHGYPCVV